MYTGDFDRIIHAIGRLKTAVQTLVTSLSNNLEDTQSITGTTMTLANTPTFIYGVYLNGQRLTKTTDYSIVGAVITFVQTLATDSVTVVYKY